MNDEKDAGSGKPPPGDETETPFERFERLARRIANVPKERIRPQKHE